MLKPRSNHTLPQATTDELNDPITVPQATTDEPKDPITVPQETTDEPKDPITVPQATTDDPNDLALADFYRQIQTTKTTDKS